MTAIDNSRRNPLHKVSRASATVESVRAGRQRRLHKAFLRYHDPENWPLLREALKQMGRADLIGNGRKQLIPFFQPAGTGLRSVAPSRAPATARVPVSGSVAAAGARRRKR